MGMRKAAQTVIYTTAIAAATLYFGFALLVVVRAPTYRLWQLSILATEWGYWFALLGLAVALGLRRRLPQVTLLAVLGAVLLLMPLMRAERGRNLDWKRLFFGAGFEDVRPQTMEYKPGLPLDLYRAGRKDTTDRKDRPLVVVIHGGSWRGGDQKQLPKLNYYLASKGYPVAAITYRLAPQHRFPAALEDVRAAVAYLKDNATRLGIDASRIVLLGRSAGGQLALLAAYTSADPAITGAISFYGVTDMFWAWDHPSPKRVLDSRGILRDYLGGSPMQVGAAYHVASPIKYVETAKPTLLIHGAKDPLVFVEHSRMLAAELRKRKRAVELVEMPWATHACDYAFNGPCGQLITQAVERFLQTRVQTGGHFNVYGWRALLSRRPAP